MEIFKDIKEYPLYSVSTQGRVMHNVTQRIMHPSKKPNGYMQINLLTCDGRRKKEYVHRLVALAFIRNPSRLPVVNHIDGVRDNNQVANLEWVTQKENVRKSAWPKKVSVFRTTSEFIGCFNSIEEACQSLSLTASNVSACLHGTQKTHKGYTFEFS